MKHFLDEYMVAFSQGDFATAEEVALGVLERGVPSAFVLNRLGLALHGQGRIGEALAAFDKAICSDPQFAEALLNGAVLLADLGFYEEAAARFEAARALDGRVQVPEGETAEPLGLYRSMVTRYLEMIEEYCALEHWERAEAETSRALEFFEAASLRLKLAEIHVAQGRTREALAELAKIATACEKNPSYFVLKAQCALAQGKRAEAVECVKKAEELSDGSRAFHVLKAVISKEQKIHS